MQKNNKTKIKVAIVLGVLILFIIFNYMSYRANYLQALEIGEEYLTVFKTNMEYKIKLFCINFIIIFISIYITNKFIKKGLKVFFEDEKKQMPKLPNKSIAFVVSIIVSIIISKLFLNKLILFVNNIWIGKSDPIFGLDIGFYFFQKPFIELILKYLISLIIGITIYMTGYYILIFNQLLEGIDKDLLRKSLFVKILKINCVVISVILALIILLNSYNIVFSEFLTLKNGLNTKVIGAGISDATIRLWGYRLLTPIIIISVILIVRNIGKLEWKKILKFVLIVPAYLVALFVIITLFDLIFVRSNRLDSEKQYISYNIENTKYAYGINIEEITLEAANSVTEEDLQNNSVIIENIPVFTDNIVLKNLNLLQTNSGYYTYRTAKLEKYIIDSKNTAVFVSPREISSSDVNSYNNKTYEYTHGYGSVIVKANNADEIGNIDYIQKEFNGDTSKVYISEPRIYYGLETNSTIVVNTKNKKELDYPITTTQNAEYEYEGNSGISLNLLDRIILSIMKKDVNLIFSSGLTSDSKVLMNRNVLQRAKKIMPYLIYDENPYMVISDSGEQIWVIDAYTVSNEYPFSQKSNIDANGTRREINYIRNSVKVLVNSYDGSIQFYITDETDPIAMAYSKAYEGIFKKKDEIPENIGKYFVYSEYLYNIQADILKIYHNVTEDVLYRGDDTWNDATYSSNTSSSAATKIDSYYLLVKNNNSYNIGLVHPYTVYGKQNLTGYLIGIENSDGSKNLKLYNYSQGSNIIGPLQLDKEIQQDTIISKEIENISITGTKITKNIIIVPINDTIVYVEPIYQEQLNEKNSVPLLKKIIVASGNKVAIGNNLKEALENLVSKNAVDIKVDNTDTIEDLIQTIIETNKNLTDSTNSGNFEMIGKDLTKLQSLIEQLEKNEEK